MIIYALFMRLLVRNMIVFLNQGS